MDNTARNRGKRELAAALAARGCGAGPTLIIVEDLHWADASSLELLDKTLDTLSNLPVLLVVSFRPEFHPPWIGLDFARLVTLPPTGALTMSRRERCFASTEAPIAFRRACVRVCSETA